MYLVKKCKQDGSTPLGETPEVEINVEVPETGHVNRGYYAMLKEFFHLYPGWDMVSWGVKEEILAYRQRNN